MAAREDPQVHKQRLEVSTRNAIEIERLDSEYLDSNPLSTTFYFMCVFSEHQLSFLQNGDENTFLKELL